MYTIAARDAGFFSKVAEPEHVSARYWAKSGWGHVYCNDCDNLELATTSINKSCAKFRGIWIAEKGGLKQIILI